MPRTSLVLTGALIVTCALILCGCGSSESVQDESSSRAVETSTAAEGDEAATDDDAPTPTGELSNTAAELDQADAETDESPEASPDSDQPPALASALVEPSAESEPAPELVEPDEVDDEPPLDSYAPRTSPAGLRVTRAYICRGIEESEPTDAGRSFLPKEDGLNRLCCFSEIAGAAAPDSIWHVWYWGEREMGRVGLEVRSSRWRTWSRKQVLDEWKGEWHVDIVDAEGFRLYRLDFSIE